jgi:hypothetical protein
MPKTAVEKSIQHKRHRSGILVPLIEDRLKWPVRVETSKDVKFLKNLFEKNQQRELDRDSERMYSPSALSECLRRVYLNKNFESVDIPRVFPPRIEPNFYFLTGEFLHLKWQYMLYKMAQEFPEIELAPDPIDSFEIRVVSKRGDHGGTADVVPAILGEHMVVDFKGLNVRSFNKISRGSVPDNYRIQIADYMILLNSERPRRYHVKDALLVAENKGGPDTHHPAALCEARISLKENKREVQIRLEALREFERKEEIPPPECVSTKGVQFTGCPFQGFCKKEVKQIEQGRTENSNANGYKVRVPEKRRSNRTRRNKQR